MRMGGIRVRRRRAAPSWESQPVPFLGPELVNGRGSGEGGMEVRRGKKGRGKYRDRGSCTWARRASE